MGNSKKVNSGLRNNLVSMLKYKRKQGSVSQLLFCEKYLEPVFGEPDLHGNYTLTIGHEPRVSFMAHHDTVHTSDGVQQVYVKDGIASVNAECLGADCTTGVWLILELIKAKIPATYVIHASEEIGCLGSKGLVDDRPKWIEHTDFAISLDRKGKDSIITHQLGYRTCSDDFAKSFAGILNLGFKADTTGSYTDSNEYIYDIPECTNLSVGYYNQHSAREIQDLDFAIALRWTLINADYSKLIVSRSVDDYDSSLSSRDWVQSINDRFREESYNDDWSDYRNKGKQNYTMSQLVKRHPDAIADMLEQMGLSVSDIQLELRDMGIL